MAARSSARAARERKQKIFVAAGGVILLLLLAIQLPKLMGGSTPSASGDTTTTVAGESTPGETTPSGATGTTPTPVSTPVGLTDTDRPLPVGPGQLRSFSAFGRKDPFVQQIKDPSSPSQGGGETGSGGGSGAGETKEPEKTPSQGFTTEAAPAVTVISVNGVRQVLEPGAAFPAADPVFVLVAENAKAKTALVGVVGGAYKNGANTTKLKVGKPLVLVNTTTGARYRVVLVAVGTVSSAPAGPQDDTPSGQTTP